MSANKDKVEGKLKQAQGRVQDAAGDLTDSPEDDMKGKARTAEGKIQETVGKVKDKIHDATR